MRRRPPAASTSAVVSYPRRSRLKRSWGRSYFLFFVAAFGFGFDLGLGLAAGFALAAAFAGLFAAGFGSGARGEGFAVDFATSVNRV